MSLRPRQSLVVALMVMAFSAACAAEPTPPDVDVMATTVMQLAIQMQTQTAVAASPTPTLTLTPAATETPTAAPTSDKSGKRPMTLAFAGCWFGPGPEYTLESNIDKGKGVELLGRGSVEGWYIIRNPYFHRPCWIAAENLKIYEGTDPSTYPVMTPGVPLPGS